MKSIASSVVSEKPNPTPAGLLLEQYKLLEERRRFFGGQFMQTIGGVAGIFFDSHWVTWWKIRK